MCEMGTGNVCEETVFSGFFRANVRSLRNYLYFKFGNEEQANDTAQEAFIKLWENCASVPLEKAKSYVYTIANNKSLNKIAHQKVVLNYSAQNRTTKGHSEDPAFIMEQKEFDRKLQNAIAMLTEGQRTAFLLNRIEGKKYAEIAEMLDISVKAVEKRIGGALAALRHAIEQTKG